VSDIFLTIARYLSYWTIYRTKCPEIRKLFK
jgi:hypothetical protein